MAKLKIYTFPDQVLTQKAQPIERVDAELRKLAEDMIETMYYAPGIGLAANQVGVLKRIIVIDTEYSLIDLPEGEEPSPDAEVADGSRIENKKPIVLINPEITFKEGKTAISEGCLSVPEYTAEVKRSEKIKVKYMDLDGVQREMAAEELQAVCIQHEIDHLDGYLFIDRLGPMKKEMAKKRLLREREARDHDPDYALRELQSPHHGKRGL